MRSSLPLSYLVSHGQHVEVLRRRLGRAVRVLDDSRRRTLRRALKRWVAGHTFLVSREFFARQLSLSRRDASAQLVAVLQRALDRRRRACVRRWRRAARRLRQAERDRRRATFRAEYRLRNSTFGLF